MLTRALAKAFAPEITVNSVAPGVIPFGELDGEATGMIKIKATPAGRGGTPDEVAGAVVYFLERVTLLQGRLWLWMAG